MLYIKDFEYHKMWNRYDLKWHNLHEDVNILVGINGKGKTTLLDAIYDYYKQKPNQKSLSVYLKKYKEGQLRGTHLDCPLYYIQTLDVPMQVRKKGNTMLYDRLMQVVVQNEQSDSFFNYRMRALNYPEEKARIEKRIEVLFKEINSYFVDSDKYISIEKDTNMLVFKEGRDEKTITLSMLSAGEKQLLLILMTVFLMDERHAVLLMDEPEVSLHIEWQERLIKSLRKLNKNCQLIVTTHSPSIFASGWENNITYIEDLYTNGE